MKIIGIETSGPQFSLCLSENDKLLFEVRKERTFFTNTRDGQLFAETRDLLGYLGGETPGAIAVSIGPGMFTSLRVGLSLAKGLNLSRKIPLYAVNTLDSIGMTAPCVADEAGDPDDRVQHCGTAIVPVINAHREEIYAAVYVDGVRASNYLLCTPVELAASVPSFFSSCAQQPAIAFIGPGAGIMKDFTEDKSGRAGLRIMENDVFMPSAFKVITLALPRISAGDADDPVKLEPFYLKKTDAERDFRP